MHVHTAVFVSTLLATACSSNPGSDSSVAKDSTDSHDRIETGDTGDIAEPSASLTGRMVDIEGAPIAGLQMRLCMDSCVTAGTDEDGVFDFSRIDVGTHTLQAVSFSDPQHSTPHALITVADGEARTLTDWLLPHFGSWEALETPSSLDLDGGLIFEADPSGLSIGPYSASGEAYVAAVRLDPATSGLPLDELGCTPAASWYLGNYDLQISPAWPITGTSELALTSGDYALRTADNDAKSWRDDGVLRIDSAGLPTLLTGGITQLTTLALCFIEGGNQ